VVAFLIYLHVEIDERLVSAEQGLQPGALRQQHRGTNQEPCDYSRTKRGAEDAELRLLQLRAVER
jgi:succinate dehydrogenase/fumarate reductase flavoprotein subunit